MSSKSEDRTVLPPAENVVSFADAVRGALLKDRRSDKELARDVEVVPRAVSNWRNGMSLPSLPSFFRLCWELPELRAQALHWLESEHNFDPNHERELLDLMRAASAVLERRQRKLEES